MLIVLFFIVLLCTFTQAHVGSCNYLTCFPRNRCQLSANCTSTRWGEVCQYVEKVCVAEDPCNRAFCNPDTGQCEEVPVEYHTNNPCLRAECVNGQWIETCGVCDEREREERPCFRSECCNGRWIYKPIEGCHRCEEDECSNEITVTVVEAHKCEVKSKGHPRCEGPHCGDLQRFEFSFANSMVPHAPKQTHVISFDEYTLCGLRKRGTCDNFLPTVSPNPPYCDLFDFNPTNDIWQVFIQGGKVEYKADFSLTELLNCRDYSGNAGLVTRSYVNNNRTQVFKGAMHATSVVPKNCNNEELCEDKACHFMCPFEIRIDLDGDTQIQMKSFPFTWNGHWVCDDFGEDGELFVTVETCVRQQHSHTLTQLGLPSVEQEPNRDFDFLFVNGTRCIQHPGKGNECCQRWVFKTSGASNKNKIKGHEVIVFYVFEGPHKKFQVRMNLDVYVKRTIGERKVHEQIGGQLTLFNDRQFKHPEHKFVGCSEACVELCLTDRQFIPQILKIDICYSDEGPLVPYDPQDPDHTGCNTPNIIVKQKTIYSIEQGSHHGFNVTFFVSEEEWKARFCLKVKPFGRQSLKVYFTSDINPSLLPSNHFRDGDHDDFDWHEHDLIVECPSHTHFDPHSDLCVSPARHVTRRHGSNIATALLIAIAVIIVFVLLFLISWYDPHLYREDKTKTV